MIGLAAEDDNVVVQAQEEGLALERIGMWRH